MVTTILATIVVLGVLIFVHELGHFMTAKAVDIEVPRFSIGFGPKVVGFKRGETEYVISLLPLGGYVKMAGMEEMEQIEGVDASDAAPGTEPAEPRVRGPRDFESKSLPARALVISAGVIMNILFAIVAFAVIAGVWGVPGDPGTRIGNVEESLLPAGTSVAGIPVGARVTAVNGNTVDSFEDFRLELLLSPTGETRIDFDSGESVTLMMPSRDRDREPIASAFIPAMEQPAVLLQIVPGGAAAAAGLETGDSVVTAGGEQIATWQHFVAVIERNPGRAVPLTIARAGQVLDITITPRDTTFDNGLRVGRIGVTVPALTGGPAVRQGPVAAVVIGAQRTWETTATTVKLLGGMIVGSQSPRNIGGPIAIGQLSGEMARLGPAAFLNLMAVLSVSLAVLNLLPIPVLDGGHLVFLAVEAVRGRALSLRSRMRLTQVGFVLILMLMVWAIGNDVLRVIGI